MPGTRPAWRDVPTPAARRRRAPPRRRGEARSGRHAPVPAWHGEQTLILLSSAGAQHQPRWVRDAPYSDLRSNTAAVFPSASTVASTLGRAPPIGQKALRGALHRAGRRCPILSLNFEVSAFGVR